MRHCACFLAGLIFTCLVINFCMPFWRAPRVYPKWQYFADHRDQFDTLFIGSSLIASQIIPGQFDLEMAKSGMPTKSFNLGSAGMFTPEHYYVLLEALKLRPLHLRWAFIEAIDMNTRESDQIVNTIRGIYWHDARQTQYAFRAISDSRRPIAEKAHSFWIHGYAFAMRTANAGRGAEWLWRNLESSDYRERSPDWLPAFGFEPTPPGTLSVSGVATFEQSLRTLKEQDPVLGVRAGFAETARSIAKELRSVNIEPIFIMPPILSHKRITGWPNEIALLCFNDPQGCARLYDPALRYDQMHLNEEGAKIFTSFLAQRFAQWRESHPLEK